MKMVKLARTKSNSPTRSTCVPKRSSQGQLKGSLRGFLYQEVDPKPHKSGVKAKKPAGQTCPAKAMAAESDTAKHFSEPNALRRWYLLKKFKVLEQLEAIADALQDNQTLIELDLSESQITDIGMQAKSEEGSTALTFEEYTVLNVRVTFECNVPKVSEGVLNFNNPNSFK